MRRVNKILIPLHDFSAGGTEIHALRLAGEWIKAGVNVDFVVGARAGGLAANLAAIAGVTVLEPQVPRSPTSRLGLGNRMIDAIARIDPDLIFIPGNFHFMLAHAFRKRLPHLPIVGKVSNPLLPPAGAMGLLAIAARPFMRAYLAPFSGLVTMSRGLEAECRKLAAASLRMTTIYDPTIPDDVAIQPMRRRSARGEPIRVLAIGRLEPQKDMSRAVDTLQCLLRLADSALTIVGDGSERARIEAKVSKLGLTGKVRFTGFIDSVANELDKADVLLVTSKYEGGPATAVEALARGVPVVSTDCSWFLREILVTPAFGAIAESNAPEALARSILRQVEATPASAVQIEAALAKCRYAVSAKEYLAAFETVSAHHAASPVGRTSSA